MVGCDSPHHANGLCSAHASRAYRLRQGQKKGASYKGGLK